MLPVLVLLAVACAPSAPLKVSLARTASVAARADGAIGGGEYAFRATDPATKIEIQASADSAALHVALRSPGAGWLAMGLGSGGMNGAVMVIAMLGGDGKWKVEEHLGKPMFRHSPVDTPNLIEAKAWQEGGRTCLEFSIPLRYSGDKALATGASTPFILAYHKDRGSLSKHTRKSSGSITLSR